MFSIFDNIYFGIEMLLMLEIHVDRNICLKVYCVCESVNTKAFVITYKESASFENATQCLCMQELIHVRQVWILKSPRYRYIRKKAEYVSFRNLKKKEKEEIR